MRISLNAILVVLLLHFVLYWFANKNIFQHYRYRNQQDIVQVSLPITVPKPYIESGPAPKAMDFTISAEEIKQQFADDEPKIEEDRYYLQSELSDPVRLLRNDASQVDVPIVHVVIVSIYVSKEGTVDDVKFEKTGGLSDDDQDKLKQAFKDLQFLPGMRGSRVVKAIYRIQLEINRKVIIRR